MNQSLSSVMNELNFTFLENFIATGFFGKKRRKSYLVAHKTFSILLLELSYLYLRLMVMRNLCMKKAQLN